MKRLFVATFAFLLLPLTSVFAFQVNVDATQCKTYDFKNNSSNGHAYLNAVAYASSDVSPVTLKRQYFNKGSNTLDRVESFNLSKPPHKIESVSLAAEHRQYIPDAKCNSVNNGATGSVSIKLTGNANRSDAPTGYKRCSCNVTWH